MSKRLARIAALGSLVAWAAVFAVGPVFASPATGGASVLPMLRGALGQAAAPAGPAAPAVEDETPPAPEDVAVAAILESRPATPAEWVRAARTLADLRRPELARQFLKQTLSANLDQAQLAALAERFGTPAFVGMGVRPELQPEARQLADAVLDAYNRQLQEPNRIAQLIRQLSDPGVDARYRALAGLEQARGAAVGPMVEALADPARAEEHPHIRTALGRLGPDAVAPLVGLLENAEPRLMAQAMLVLAGMEAKPAAIYMLGPFTSPASDPAVRTAAGAALRHLLGELPDRAAAVDLLVRRAEDYFTGRQPLEGERDGQIELWSWDPGRKLSASRSLPADLAAREMAVRLARDAFALAPESRRVQVLYLAAMFESAKHAGGLDQPLADGEGSVLRLAARFEPAVVESALEYAMAVDRPAAAAGAAEALGALGEAEALLRRGVGPSRLVLASQSPDRRVRLAALESMVRLQPARPYPGAGYVAPGIAFLAGTSGSRRALVAGPGGFVSSLAGLAASLGYDVESVTRGDDVIRLAASSPDFELALIDAGIGEPTIDLLLQRLRRDPRSADLRVALVARDGFLPRARQVADRDRLAMAFSRPHAKEDLQWQIDRLGEIEPRRVVGAEERRAQAVRAMRLLVALSEAPGALYDMRRTEAAVLGALYVPELTPDAAQVLGRLGTPAAQRALVDLAGRFTQPIEIRRAALEAFGRSVERHGILLRSGEIVEQYERYNRSAEMDQATQQILGAILDLIEAPSRVAGTNEPADATP